MHPQTAPLPSPSRYSSAPCMPYWGGPCSPSSCFVLHRGARGKWRSTPYRTGPHGVERSGATSKSRRRPPRIMCCLLSFTRQQLQKALAARSSFVARDEVPTRVRKDHQEQHNAHPPTDRSSSSAPSLGPRSRPGSTRLQHAMVRSGQLSCSTTSIRSSSRIRSENNVVL